MGAFLSTLSDVAETFTTDYCEKHNKKAEAFCITHKELICMSCIVQNDHNETDCNIHEIESVDLYTKQCTFAKSCLRFRSVVQCAETIESEMQIEIEDAYSEAMEHLKECKSASYEVTRTEVTTLITCKKGLIVQQRNKLDAAIGYFLSGNLVEGQTAVREIINGHHSYGITFQKKIPFADTEEQSFVHVKEVTIQEDKGWLEFCRCLSNVQNFKSEFDTKVNLDDSNDPDEADPDDDVNDIAQLYKEKSEPA